MLLKLTDKGYRIIAHNYQLNWSLVRFIEYLNNHEECFKTSYPILIDNKNKCGSLAGNIMFKSIEKNEILVELSLFKSTMHDEIIKEICENSGLAINPWMYNKENELLAVGLTPVPSEIQDYNTGDF